MKIKNNELQLMNEIIHIVSDYYGVDIKEDTNRRIISTPRNICVYLIREMTKTLSVELMADQFNRGASNFFNTNLRLVNEMQVNKSLRRQVETLKMVIKTDAKHYHTIGNDAVRLEIYKMLNRFNIEKLKDIKETIENTVTY
tara:strand:- start:657 stop:1082 length:426 start_codon:yes stop_codon:yes gene_type:complete